MEAATSLKRPASFWFFAIATAALFLTSSTILTHALMSSDRLAKKAIKQGQRVTVTLESGKIEGNPFKEKPKPAVADTAKPPVTKPPLSNNGKPDTAVPMQPTLPSLNGTQPPVVPDAIGDMAPETEFGAPTPKGSIPMPQIGRGTSSLAIAPFTPMTEKVGDLVLPRIAPETKEAPWKYYGKDIGETKRPMVAIVVSGLGQSRRMTDQALSLAPLYTLSFSPYGKDAPLWIINARNKGFESWVDLPVEPADYPASDPGPHAILNDKSDLDNMNNLHWTLSRLPGFAGVVIPASENLTQNDALALQLSKEISSRGLQITYIPSANNKTFSKESKGAKQLIVPIDLNVDEMLSKADILNRLQALIAKAKKDGHAVGIVRGYPVSIETLKEWTASLKDSGVDLVPLTAVAQKIQ